jgi:hypothetical protein
MFELDYIKMAELRTRIILEDLMKNALHPRRIIRFLELGGEWMIFKKPTRRHFLRVSELS